MGRFHIELNTGRRLKSTMHCHQQHLPDEPIEYFTREACAPRYFRDASVGLGEKASINRLIHVTINRFGNLAFLLIGQETSALAVKLVSLLIWGPPLSHVDG